MGSERANGRKGHTTEEEEGRRGRAEKKKGGIGRRRKEVDTEENREAFKTLMRGSKVEQGKE